eukprot:g29982.t1
MIVHTQSFTPDIVDATINHSAGKCDLEWHCEFARRPLVCRDPPPCQDLAVAATKLEVSLKELWAMILRGVPAEPWRAAREDVWNHGRVIVLLSDGDRVAVRADNVKLNF